MARVPAAIVQLGAETFMPLLVVALLVALIIVLAGLRVANQYERAVVFRFGRYQGTRGPGLYWLIPAVEWQSKVDLRVITAPVELRIVLGQHTLDDVLKKQEVVA
jgi:regulator of protease activity HflC (stomatin/prohibitin superfamily)